MLSLSNFTIGTLNYPDSMAEEVRIMDNFVQHPDNEVQQAITRLADALCSWERSTGLQSVLIIREQGDPGFVFRAMSGKPGIPDDITDQQMVDTIRRG